MKKMTIFLAVILSMPLIADGHLDSEKAVMDLVLKHWEARDNNDYQTQADLMSPSGTYNANSDGSFFRFA
mgnify:FL=1